MTQGPVMLISALSLSPGVVVVLSSSVNVTVAEDTDRLPVAVPGMVIVSSPSTTASSVGVIVNDPVWLEVFAGIVIDASDVAE